MVEIQMLSYAGENNRTQTSILRFNNQAFLHLMLCKILLGCKLQEIYTRKFYGSYFHALMLHGGLQIQIVSGMTAFAEGEERFFQKAKSITARTSNNHAGHIIGNIILRSQVEDKFQSYIFSQVSGTCRGRLQL